MLLRMVETIFPILFRGLSMCVSILTGLISMLANFRRPASSVFGLFTQPEVREVVYEVGLLGRLCESGWLPVGCRLAYGSAYVGSFDSVRTVCACPIGAASWSPSCGTFSWICLEIHWPKRSKLQLLSCGSCGSYF